MIGRREAGVAVLSAGLGMLSAFSASPAQGAVETSHETAMRDIIAGFYDHMNLGNWQALSDILSEDVRMRSNYFYSTDQSTYQIGGNILGRDGVIEFIKKRQIADNVIWDYDSNKVFRQDGNYLCSFAHPRNRNAGCSGLVSCTFEKVFVHVFWFQSAKYGVELKIPTLADITEVDLMMVGTS